MHEDNDTQAQAVAPTGPVQGRISYRGDTDWFAVTSAANGILRVSLEMPVTTLNS